MSSPITLGLDLGTSAVKVVALGWDDVLLGEGVAPFDTTTLLPGQAEQSPQDWLHATGVAMQGLRDSLDRTHGTGWLDRISAIGVTGQLPTLVCLADEGVVAPAITWRDGRADVWAATRVDVTTRKQLYASTGMPIDGRYLAPMLQLHFGERLSDIACILSAKDYLVHALTGRRVTEPSTAAGYGVYDLAKRGFAEDLCRFWDLPTRLLPQILPANSLAGALSTSGAALLGLPPGIPVSTGAADSVCAAYAMTGLDERSVSVSFGSSAVIVGVSSTARLDPSARYLVTPHVSDGWYGLEMDLLATGTGYRWLSDLFGWTGNELDLHARESVPGGHGLFVPPYLGGGEQGVLWNPRLKGALLGLTLRHTRQDIARAYLEGVFYEIRRCIDVLGEFTPVDHVRVSGNLVHAPQSIQMLADILNCGVSASKDKSPAAIGAAALARTIATTGRQTETVVRETLPITQPNADTVRVYQSLYQEYVGRAAACE